MKPVFYLFAAAVAIMSGAPVSAQGVESQPSSVMLDLDTGSQVATWTLSPEKPSHEAPVIFLHGGPGMYTTPGVMAKGAPLRKAGFTTIYFDQAGSGRSRRLVAKDYTIDRAIADLESLRVKLGTDKVILWGSSYGASLATIYTTRFPDRVAGIILTSPGSYPGTNSKRDYKGTNRSKIDLSPSISVAIGKIDKQGGDAEAGLSQADAGMLFDDLVNAELMGAMVCKGADLKAPPPGTGGNLYANRMISKDLDRIKFKPAALFRIPALIVRGSCDFLPESNAAQYAKLFRTSVTAIPQSGHGLLENPSAVENVFNAFAAGPLAAAK